MGFWGVFCSQKAGTSIVKMPSSSPLTFQSKKKKKNFASHWRPRRVVLIVIVWCVWRRRLLLKLAKARQQSNESPSLSSPIKTLPMIITLDLCLFERDAFKFFCPFQPFLSTVFENSCFLPDIFLASCGKSYPSWFTCNCKSNLDGRFQPGN